MTHDPFVDRPLAEPGQVVRLTWGELGVQGRPLEQVHILVYCEHGEFRLAVTPSLGIDQPIHEGIAKTYAGWRAQTGCGCRTVAEA